MTSQGFVPISSPRLVIAYELSCPFSWGKFCIIYRCLSYCDIRRWPFCVFDSIIRIAFSYLLRGDTLTARINYLNIGILLVLLVSGVLVAFQDGQHDKAAVASGITRIGASVSDVLPSPSLQEAMPSITVNQADNSVVVTSGFIVLIVGVFLVMAFFLTGFIRCMGGCARC
jgi:hypothetical protein